MSQLKVILSAAIAVALAATLAAQTATTDLTLRIPDESVPAGGMIQMKVLTTEVTPISWGRPSLTYDPTMFASAAGFGLFNPNGDTVGAAVINGTHVQIFYDSTATLTANYPILTVVLRVRPDAVPGSKTLFTLDPTSLFNYSTLGPVTATIKPATVTVGGSVAITDVVPGEGFVPAGTVVSVRGIGFTPRTQVRVTDAPASKGVFVGANEMQFTVLEPTNITGLRITVSDVGPAATYYAYMRGIPAATSARTLLAQTEPIFSMTQRQTATLEPFPAFAANQYAGIALQNPNMTAVSVQLALRDANGKLIHASTKSLAARNRLALEVSELLDGVAPTAGSYVVVTASAPIDVFSLMCDEGSGTVVPLLPR